MRYKLASYTVSGNPGPCTASGPGTPGNSMDVVIEVDASDLENFDGVQIAPTFADGSVISEYSGNTSDLYVEHSREGTHPFLKLRFPREGESESRYEWPLNYPLAEPPCALTIVIRRD